MRTSPPSLEQFRVEPQANGLVHLVFDAPGRTMNVFSNAATHELSALARWLADSEARGAVIRSAKATAFCAGADLGELGVAYDMIMAAAPAARFNLAFDHFFSLSAAIRALETSGKPVAAAIAGLALGGGCELALGAHYRVLVDDPRVGLGLPEALVGLLPGAGGTQRLPALIGLDAALPVLLDGARLSGRAALDAGLVHELVAPGQEIAAAERWPLSDHAVAVQPWDHATYRPPRPEAIGPVLAPVRVRILEQTLGHYPAPLAILDCLEFGAPQGFDGAIRSEMAIFAHLIQRREARNMIQTMFLGKTDLERLGRKNATPSVLSEVVAAAKAAMDFSADEARAMAAAGWANVERPAPVQDRPSAGYWVEEVGDPRQAVAARALKRISRAVSPWREALSPDLLRMADYAIVKETGYPAYLGGPFAFGDRATAERGA